MRVGRGRAVRPGAARTAVRGADTQGLRRGGADAGRRLQHPLRPACRLPASRRRASQAARAQGRTPHRDLVGWHHPGCRRLRRVAGAAGDRHRQRQRGLRDREHGRRRVPARQCQLPHPADRKRSPAGGGCAGPAAQHPVLAGRGTGSQHRTVAVGVAVACGVAGKAGRRGRRCRAALVARWTRAGRIRRGADRRIRGRATGRLRHAAHPAAHRAGALLRRIRRHSAGDPFAVRKPHQQGLGAGAAQAFLPQVQFRIAGGGDRGRDRAVAVDQPQLPVDRGDELPAFGKRQTGAGAGAAGCAAVPRALPLERDHRAGAATFRRRQEGRAAAAADEIRGPDGDGVSGSGRLPGEHRRRARGTRPSAGRADPARLPV